MICREGPRQRIRLLNIEIESRREDFKVVKVRDTHTHMQCTHTHTQANTQNHSHTKIVAHTHTHTLNLNLLHFLILPIKGEKAEINRALKEAVKRSSLEFGNEAIRYESVMAEEMKRQGVVGNSSDYTQRYGAVRYITHHQSVC